MTQDKIVNANGIAFHCRIDGPDGAGPEAPWLVFSNSLMTDLGLWQDQADAFADRYRILRYDQRGHGGTSVPSGACDFDSLADDVAGLFDAFGIGEAAVIGVSMGGVTALHLAARYPSRVRALVVSDATARTAPGGAAAWDERIAVASKGGMEALVEPTVRRWFHPASLEAGTPALQRVRAMIGRTPLDGFVRAARALQSFDFTAGLPNIRCPTLMLAGASDGAVPETMRGMAEQVPGAAFVEILGAGHLPNIELPEAFNRELQTFLDQAAFSGSR